MIEIVSMLIVALAAVFLVLLGIVALLHPASAQGFLLAFAGSARVHFFELSLRLIIGLGFLGCSAVLKFGEVFRAVGWVLILTTLVMAIVPWKIHRQFTNWAVPKALRFTPLIGVTAIAMGTTVFIFLVTGKAA